MRNVKIFSICLILGLFSACGPDETQSPVAPSEGEGELRLWGDLSPTNSKTFKLFRQSSEGEVFCQHLEDSEVLIALGSFYRSQRGMEPSVPLNGLSIIARDISPGRYMAKESYFNIESTMPSSPRCQLEVVESSSAMVKGSLQCVDNIERDYWGWLELRASFECRF